MRKYALLLAVVCSLNAANVSFVTDREDAVYELNEQAGFVINSDTPIDCKLTFTFDGAQELKTASVSVAAEPVTSYASLKEPGFLRCILEYTDPETGETKNLAAAAGFEPEKIKPAFEKTPKEFTEFWNERKRRLKFIPINPIMVPVEAGDEDLELFDIKLDCIGKRVRGYYAKQKNALNGKCPAILFLQGAGVYSARKGSVTEYAREGFIALEINAHGVPNGRSREYYAELYKGRLYNYKHWGKESPYTSYFTGMFTRVVRALEFLKNQPEWDGKNLVAYGSSQGGAQALAAAGLDSDVNIVMAAVPGMCDHSGKINGWPRIVPREPDGSYNEQISKAAAYLDCVNFVRQAKARAIFTVGFIDNVCRPTSVYAAYNSSPNQKEIINEPLMGHKFLKKHREYAKTRIIDLVKGQ